MTRSFSFQQQLAVGDEGLNLLVAHLREAGFTVEDCTHDKTAQNRDIDLVVDGMTVEVKSDTHRMTNLFLEMTCGNKPGCLFKSRADLWAYVFPKDQTYFWIALPDLQWWAATHSGDYRPIVICSHRGSHLWKATGIAVPIADLEASGIRIGRYRMGEKSESARGA